MKKMNKYHSIFLFYKLCPQNYPVCLLASYLNMIIIIIYNNINVYKILGIITTMTKHLFKVDNYDSERHNGECLCIMPSQSMFRLE